MKLKQRVHLIALGGFLVLATVVLSSCGTSTFVRFPDYEEPEVITRILGDIPTVVTPRRILDGVAVKSESGRNPFPAAIIVENAADAWPISGIDNAQIVYEALAESFIPRLLAIYAINQNVEKIGPVRSSRPYFVDWADGYEGLFMHVGGSPEGLRRARNGEVTDVDEFRYGGTYFWRSNGRKAPHNVYTSTELAASFVEDKGIELPEFRMWKYRDEIPFDSRPEDVDDIVVNFTTETYKARWKYDRNTNEYVRYQNERVFSTLEGDEIRAKNIIVTLNETSVIDAVGRRKIVTVGEGDAWIFRNGEVIEGVWKKDSKEDREVFYNKEGDEVDLVGGKTWIEVIPNSNMLEY